MTRLVIFIVLTICTSTAFAFSPANYVNEERPSRATALTFVPPTSTEIQTLDRLMPQFYRALEASDVESLELTGRELAAVGLELKWTKMGGTRLVLLEDATHRGAGGYVFRLGEAQDVLIQAPHAYHDLDTGAVAANVFKNTSVRGLFFNTFHRHDADESDVTHQDTSFFAQLTRAYVESSQGATVVQVHGFGAQSVQPGVGIVLSDGKGHDDMSDFASRLGKLTGERVAVYGADTKVLGGTQNVVGRDVRRLGGRFLHIEMSRKARKAAAGGHNGLVDALATWGRAGV